MNRQSGRAGPETIIGYRSMCELCFAARVRCGSERDFFPTVQPPMLALRRPKRVLRLLPSSVAVHTLIGIPKTHVDILICLCSRNREDGTRPQQLSHLRQADTYLRSRPHSYYGQLGMLACAHPEYSGQTTRTTGELLEKSSVDGKLARYDPAGSCTSYQALNSAV